MKSNYFHLFINDRGFIRDIKPYVKQLDSILDKILGGNKFTPTPTNILLMAVVILLLTLLLESNEKPKRVMVVDKPKKATSSEKSE